MVSFHSSVSAGATIGLGLIVLVWILYRFKGNPNNTKLVQPPGPRPWPIIGSLHLLGKLPHQALTDLSKKYGPIMFLRLGSAPTVVVSSPAMAKEFLKTNDLIFANRPRSANGKYVHYDYKDVAFTHYGTYWRQMRKLLTVELLTVKRVESFKLGREEEVWAMIRSIWEQSRGGVCCVDVTRNLSNLTRNIIFRMMASRTYSDYELGGSQSFKVMVDEMFSVAGAFCVGDFIPRLQWLDLQGIHRRMKNVNKIFNEFAEKVIDEHIDRRRMAKGGEEEHLRVKDLVDVLLDMAESESQTTMDMKITRLHIKAVMIDMMNAGTETSLTTLEWAMSELLRNPQILAKAQQEIESVVGRNRNVKEHDLVSFEYLRCVVKETFRLHPPVPMMIPHESMEGCSVGRYYIPPKTRLLVNAWAIGRDGSVWDDPCEFKPERFLGKNMDVRGQDFELLPFGSGRRGCPGISLGLAVVDLALAQLLHCFDWYVEGEVNMEEDFRLTVPRKFPLLLRPTTWRLTI